VNFFSEVKKLFQSFESDVVERLDTAEASFVITYNSLPTIEKFGEIISLVPARDSLRITLTNDSNDMVTFTNHQTVPYNYVSLIDGLQSDDSIRILILISKTVADEKFSIYEYEAFVEDLLQRPLTEIMSWFSLHLSGQTSLIFEVFDYDVSFATRTIAFESCEDASFIPVVNRLVRLNECKENSCFYNMNVFEVIPDDFIIQGIVRTSTSLQSLFNRIATILSFAYVASSSSIENDKINIQISGQRTVNYEMTLASIAKDDKWQNIYTWIYTDGNPTDKSLIAHNVISLHCKFEAVLSLDSTVFEAIKTNYNLYLRKNVDKYLDMKRDIAKFIRDVVSRVGDYAVDILGKFRANLIAIFGFLFTVVLPRIGSTQRWDDIFTRDTVYLIEIFVIGSLAYLIVCFFETRFKLKKTRKSYFALKDNYKDVLAEAELKEAFKNDKLFEETEKIAEWGMRIWSIVWGSLLIATVVVIECLVSSRGLIAWLWNKLF
jgi:hypothetical protein